MSDTTEAVVLRTPEEAGLQVRRAEATLAIWRFRANKLMKEGKPVPTGINLAWVDQNGRIFYRQCDIDKYMAQLTPTLRTRGYLRPRKPSPGAPPDTPEQKRRKQRARQMAENQRRRHRNRRAEA